ncbi:unnamed protein product [Prorocentrum cordatum]|uniref:Non-specific serine/threonine protein kinase n=1 Tax=Prorocentrum cordatum TaxID=2364126 RepID=A0ABN9QCW9_9DINO|nr:unnamed protein product [Polarella glacialis]
MLAAELEPKGFEIGSSGLGGAAYILRKAHDPVPAVKICVSADNDILCEVERDTFVEFDIVSLVESDAFSIVLLAQKWTWTLFATTRLALVLEDAKGLPEDDGLLSIKVGNTKRQAPASKIGQPFRFATSLADPSPIKVEVFVPAAPAQTVTLDPGAETFQVSFGDMQAYPRARAEELERPPVDIQAAAEAKGLPSEKLHAATQAANYLEEHNLVKMFQEAMRDEGVRFECERMSAPSPPVTPQGGRSRNRGCGRSLEVDDITHIEFEEILSSRIA